VRILAQFRVRFADRNADVAIDNLIQILEQVASLLHLGSLGGIGFFL